LVKEVIGKGPADLACYDAPMSPGRAACALAAVLLAAGPAAYAHVPETATESPIVLTPAQKRQVVDAWIDHKPNPGYYAVASAVLPGLGQLALGEWLEPAVVWGVLVGASLVAYGQCEGVANIHPAFLATTPYVLLNGVTIPGSKACGEPKVIYNRALMLTYLVGAGYTAWRTYDLAIRRRAEIDRRIEALEP